MFLFCSLVSSFVEIDSSGIKDDVQVYCAQEGDLTLTFSETQDGIESKKNNFVVPSGVDFSKK